MQCLKCGAERNLKDFQCPECGVFYAKAEAALAKKQKLEAELLEKEKLKKEVEEKKQLKESSEKQNKTTEPEETGCIVYSIKNPGCLLEVFEDKLRLTPVGILGIITKGVKGSKEIPFYSISAIQFKECGWTNGFIQFSIVGRDEKKLDVFEATYKDENSFVFIDKKDNNLFLEIKSYVESQIKKSRIPPKDTHSTSLSDELQKLALLKEQGVLSDDEFKLAKTKLLIG